MKNSYLILLVKSLCVIIIFLASSAVNSQDLYSGGTNSWVLHTPDDGRTSLYVAPGVNSGNWNWGNGAEFRDDGQLFLASHISATGLYKRTSGDLWIGGPDFGSDNGHGINFTAVNNGFNFQTYYSGWASRFYISDNGNIGIGLTNPYFTVSTQNDGTIATSTLRLQNSYLGLGNFYGIQLVGVDNGVDGHNLYFQGRTSNVGAFNNLMVLTNHGRLGVGLTNPGSQLHLGSDENHAFTISRANGTYGFRIFRDASGGVVDFQIGSALNTWETKIRIGEGEGANTKLLLNPNGGNVGIGTNTPSEKLSVNGTIRSKEVKVEASPWPDYVFEEGYKLRSLEETKTYIDTHKHLPEVPSAQEIEENGVALGEMNMLLLKKIEELTLHQIQLSELIRTQQKEIEKLKK